MWVRTQSGFHLSTGLIGEGREDDLRHFASTMQYVEEHRNDPELERLFENIKILAERCEPSVLKAA